MKVLKIILIVVLFIVMIVVSVYAYYGGFTKIECKVSTQGGEIFIYEEMIGDYSQSSQVMDKVYNSLLNNEKIETFKGCGIYYDNPKYVERSKLRSELGCLLEERDTNKLTLLKNKYQIKTFPVGNYVVVEFPFKGFLSVMIGIMRVYPNIGEYVKTNGYSEKGAITEIYDVPNKKIIYRKEITNK
ncbi:MAG: GyrI-like domain-containing protein [Bacteroidales bacterium]|mgnify:CR=1 FL=1|jgi:effector-binding domain-containing protein|nr:GyrI-like domain-containing protein [Bacteroidales bacterium]